MLPCHAYKFAFLSFAVMASLRQEDSMAVRQSMDELVYAEAAALAPAPEAEAASDASARLTHPVGSRLRGRGGVAGTDSAPAAAKAAEAAASAVQCAIRAQHLETRRRWAVAMRA